MGIGLLIGLSGALTIGGGLSARSKARSAAAKARGLKIQAENRLKELESSRQTIINPFRNIENLSDMAQDLSSMITNPFANLGVATSAAEIQIEEADIALANTLDTLMASGAGAGGATALAQAALRSKKNVAASIETQEKSNEDRRAQGEADLERRQLAEKQRIEGIAMSQAEKVQQAEASGKQFVFNATEQREDAKIDRVATQLDNAQAQMAQANRDGTSAITGAIGGITSAFAAG